ncbi:MAG: DUF4185 domain-containing protein [Ignavibacteriales bacterium]|nr:DUF4185 domain-containing protein [Ignavibacteriales bacterium]
MNLKKFKYLTIAISLSVLPFFNGCLFESVKQPTSAQPGEIIDVSLTITDNIVPEPNAHKGILGIIAPVDWELISASYSSVLGNGTLSISSEWKDSIDLYYPANQFGSNMKWIVLISDQGYAYNNISSFNVQLKLKVGQTQGCFNLGYLTTKATSGLVSSGNPTWVSISYPHPIGVPDSNLCRVTYKTRSAVEWNNLLDRKSGWTGADGIYSIPLNEYDAPSNNPAGNQLILFSDTFIGEVDSSNHRLNAKLVNNTLALLQSNNPDSNEIKFFWGKDSGNSPKAVFVPATPNAKPGDWYWLMDGISLSDTIYVFALRLNGTIGGLGFEVNGVALLKFTLDEQKFISNVQQFDTPLFVKNEAANWEIVLGQAIMPMTSNSGNPFPDGYIYIYGPRSGSTGKELVAARVLPEEIENFSLWQFWNRTNWVSGIENCAPITNGISQEFSVSPVKDGNYLLVFQTSNSVAIKIGESPTGPFGISQSIYNCPEILIDPDIFVYNAKAHPNLSNLDELLISYNVNSYSFWDHFNNADIYRPRFIYLTINDSTTSVTNNDNNLPADFKLNQNYPNPFNPSTRISFSVPKKSNISIKIFNALGEMISEILNRNYSAGNCEISFDASSILGGLASGVYFYRMEAGEFVQTKKMILIR